MKLLTWGKEQHPNQNICPSAVPSALAALGTVDKLS